MTYLYILETFCNQTTPKGARILVCCLRWAFIYSEAHQLLPPESLSTTPWPGPYSPLPLSTGLSLLLTFSSIPISHALLQNPSPLPYPLLLGSVGLAPSTASVSVGFVVRLLWPCPHLGRSRNPRRSGRPSSRLSRHNATAGRSLSFELAQPIVKILQICC